MMEAIKVVELQNKIEALLKENEATAQVTIYVPGIARVFSMFEAPYSAIKPLKDENGNVVGVRVRSLNRDYPTQEDKEKHQKGTLDMLAHLKEGTEHQLKVITTILTELKAEMERQAKH